ncbi:MoxR family ATPase [Candidatus Sumerlaeota bacterium]|nr:MoxR family ATPase [Candidatus Sumerlaeota bacterium]
MQTQAARKIIDNMEQCLIGKREAVTQIVAAMLCRGHALLEDVPGVGKTVLARALAKSIEAKFTRLQMTPDLLPSDITGVPVFDPAKREFEFRPGPVFTQILLADELNRATPRSQSALLESMEEGQVTMDGETHPLPRPFFVIATQNPIEQHGVYHLPEAQLDRFLIQISLGYPSLQEEMDVLSRQKKSHPLDALEPVCQAEELLEASDAVREIYVEESVQEYIVRLCRATREHPDLTLGGSPRASLALRRMSQAWTLIHEERFVLPDVVKKLFLPVLRHRVLLTPQARLSGVKADDVLIKILNSVHAPVMDEMGAS